ncbi:hypothetical protein [Carboxylicivirga marina]|uniref:hypothetical protein n=1 Tax=Carboxylicivirga marina TaxID=2800988 RepID=UPI00259794BD|nr:hypothetical protein [uncultured Carboxylicivirga sp.]
MRKHKNLPHFNVGRDGNVVYYLVGEQMRLKSYACPKDPKTEKQIKNRNLHAELTLISAQTKALRQFCYKEVPTYNNSHNAFIGLHKQFMRKARLDSEKVYENLHWSRGERAGVASVTVRRSSGHFRLEWHPGNLTALSDVQSRVIWVLRNLTHGYWEWNLNAALRPDGHCNVSLFDKHYMDEYLLWIFFYNPKLKRFSEDQIVHSPANKSIFTIEFGGNNKTPWNMFEWLYPEIIAKRRE